MKSYTRRLVTTLAAAGLAFGATPAAAQVVEYYHLDALGSVRVVSNQAGTEVERHDYLPFGEEWNPPAGGQPRRFTGKERDTETGFDYFGARYYGSRIARFTTVDPVMDQQAALVNPQRWNRYAYALNNPLRYLDPDGRDAIWVQHSDKTATLVIPVHFVGAGATETNVAAIVARANGVTLLGTKVSVQIVSTATPLKGKLNQLDLSPGLDRKCPQGECVYRLGGTKGHINSDYHDAIDAAAHEVFHFAGIDDGYEDGPRDEQGRRTRVLRPGFTDSNLMASRRGTELQATQLEEARRNRSTVKCHGKGSVCQ